MIDLKAAYEGVDRILGEHGLRRDVSYVVRLEVWNHYQGVPRLELSAYLAKPVNEIVSGPTVEALLVAVEGLVRRHLGLAPSSLQPPQIRVLDRVSAVEVPT